MSADLLAALGRASLAFAAAVSIVLLVRPLIRRWGGARVAYALWLMPVLALVAAVTPRPAFPPLLAGPGAGLVATALPALAAGRSVPATRLGVAGPQDVGEVWIDAAAVGAALWLSGGIASLALLAWRQRRFTTRLGALTERQHGRSTVFVADTAGFSPALVGVIRPRMIVPADFHQRFTADEQALIIAHEQNHRRRRDPLANALAAALQCLLWFHPLLYLATRALRLDQELACDEATIAGQPQRLRSYAGAMVKLQFIGGAVPFGCSWPSAGGHPLNQRIAMLRHQVTTVKRRTAMVVVFVLTGSSAYLVSASQPESHPEPGRTSPSTVAPAPASTAGMSSADADSARIARALPEALPTKVSPSLHDATRQEPPAVGEQMAAAASVNQVRPGDGTPLIEAARRGRVDLVTRLLDRGADPNLASPGDGNPLIMAALHGHLDVVRVLTDRGADLDAVVPGDETPLINAAGRGHLPVVRYLVERGADINLALDVTAREGRLERRSPLAQARRGGHQAVIEFLVAAGAQP